MRQGVRDMADDPREHPLPGTTKPRRFVPKLHYELLICGVRGHELLGTDVAQVRPEDAVVVREGRDGTRWHRCLRCDSWLPLATPPRDAVVRDVLPPREEIDVPLRGRALRDKVVLRLIALDRVFHVIVLAVIAVAIFLFRANESSLRDPAYRVLADIQSALGGTPQRSDHGIAYDIHHWFSLSPRELTKIGLLVSAYALLEAVEAVGLWWQKRWAEYLTFIATTALVPLELYELSRGFSALKIIALIVNLAIVVYLLLAKRLFGLRGGARVEREERAADLGWEALDRTSPP
jgi:uncharacterized membrane protein (DUF2068 family)